MASSEGTTTRLHTALAEFKIARRGGGVTMESLDRPDGLKRRVVIPSFAAEMAKFLLQVTG